MLPPARRTARSATVGVLVAAALATGCGAADPAPIPAPVAAATTAAGVAGGPARSTAPGAPSAGALAPTTAARTPAPTRRPAPAGTPARPPAAPNPPAPPVPAGPAGGQIGDAKLYGISCGQSEAEVAASGAPRVRRGSTTIYAGAQQVGGNNQDPRVIRFDGGRQTWCRTDLESTGDDGNAYGLFWSGSTLLAVVSATGAQGSPSEDLRRFTASGWLTSYSDAAPMGGGGPKVAAVVRLDPATGAGIPGNGTWLTANRKGKVNSVAVTAIAPAGGGYRISINSWFSPRGIDRKPLTCTGGSPFAMTYTFDAALRSVGAVTSDPRCR